MRYSIVIVGIDHFEDYTLPLIRSIFEHQSAEFGNIVVIDNESRKPYPGFPGVRMRRIPRCSYARAINQGIEHALYSDWYIVINNDVLCTGPVGEFVDTLKDGALYGQHKNIDWSRTWIDGWFYAIPFCVLQTVGKFDEAFQVAAFEDADYCWRAQHAGFEVRYTQPPFKHLEARTRLAERNFDGLRLANRAYLMKKWGLT